MPYFKACHLEVTRFQLSTLMIIPRYVSEGGMDLYGLHAPAGAEIGANSYVIQRHKKVFGDDADVFRPERWMEDDARALHLEKHILTWRYGTRICLGKNIALMETYKLKSQVNKIYRALSVIYTDLCRRFFRIFKPRICDNNNVWRADNLALLVHWDMWINI